MSYGYPVDPDTRISQDFGGNPNSVQPDGHTGMDMALPIGSPLYAIADGTVLVSDWADNVLGPNNAYGLAVTSWLGRSAGITIIIDHGDIISIYGHCNEAPLNAGDKVKRGQLVGRSGDTGYTFGAHLHFEIMPKPVRWAGVRWYGRVNPLKYISKESVAPAAPALSPTQRIVGEKGAKYRPEPNTQKAETQIFKHGDVLNFDGWVHGEKVNSGGVENDIWLRGALTQGWVWIGAVEPFTEAGLMDLNTAPAPAPASNQRTVLSGGANQRAQPNTGAAITSKLEGGFIFTARGFVTNGEPVEGNPVWFIGENSGHFIWSGGVEGGANTNGLTDLTPSASPNPPPAPTPEPVPVPAPEPAPPVHVPPVVDAFRGDLPCITEYIPAGAGNFEVGNFPEKPTSCVVHDYGTHGRDTYQSTINHFKTGGRAKPSSAHVVISGEHITQMVKFFGPDRCRAYHAGPDGNGFIGVEIDPAINTDTELGRKTKASARLFFKQLYELYGYELKLVEHNQIMSTLCGDDIDLKWFENLKESPVEPVTPSQPAPSPAPSPVMKSSLGEIADTMELLASQIRNL